MKQEGFCLLCPIALHCTHQLPWSGCKATHPMLRPAPRPRPVSCPTPCVQRPSVHRGSDTVQRHSVAGSQGPSPPARPSPARSRGAASATRGRAPWSPPSPSGHVPFHAMATAGRAVTAAAGRDLQTAAAPGGVGARPKRWLADTAPVHGPGARRAWPGQAEPGPRDTAPRPGPSGGPRPGRWQARCAWLGAGVPAVMLQFWGQHCHAFLRRPATTAPHCMPTKIQVS